MNEKMYWYELVYRGISPGCYPAKPMAVEKDHVNFKGFNFGAVAYSKPLTEKQIKSYELNAIDPLREMNDVEIYCYKAKEIKK